MIEEIRIYYESLEQGAHYIQPLIEKALKDSGKNIRIKLIKLKGNYSYYSQKIAPIIFWKDPDILITVLFKNVEYPLLLIEFSTAVFTEDHELQRFDGLRAAADCNCIYIKISPTTKQSQNQHGGNINFNHINSFALIYKKLGKIFFHFDWKCSENGIVEVDDTFLSCPKNIPGFNRFIDMMTVFITKYHFNGETWINDFEKYFSGDVLLREWKNKIINCKLPSIKDLRSSRTEWNQDTKEFTLKLNRFGHSMDPERGMLAYYGLLFERTVSKMIFDQNQNAWYKDIPKESEINKYLRKNDIRTGYDLLYCFMLGSGLYNNKDFVEIVRKYRKVNEIILNIDLTKFLNDNYHILNKAMRTIFYNSMYFVINDKYNRVRLVFRWQKFNNIMDYLPFPNVTEIKERDSFDEDDVTYISVHNILKINNYKIIAVSYPGAQGDRVVLVAPGTGRRQKRKYIDIIASLPEKCTNLQENKGKYTRSQIQKDIDELKKYKQEGSYKKAVNIYIDRFDINAPKIIKIGIGFWANTKYTVDKIKDLDLTSIDYFVYLSTDRKEWYIWSTGEVEMFKKTKGSINIPITYEVKKTNN